MYIYTHTHTYKICNCIKIINKIGKKGTFLEITLERKSNFSRLFNVILIPTQAEKNRKLKFWNS